MNNEQLLTTLFGQEPHDMTSTAIQDEPLAQDENLAPVVITVTLKPGQENEVFLGPIGEGEVEVINIEIPQEGTFEENIPETSEDDGKLVKNADKYYEYYWSGGKISLLTYLQRVKV
jgi:hypothetical protein